MINIAVIDNGVLKDLMNNQLECKCINFCNDKEDKNVQSLHGTIVSLIIMKYLQRCNIISISILNNNGMGSVDLLENALEWCLENGVSIVNLSFGTTCFLDKMKIQRCINYYANKGLCLVAAVANNGFVTYPASFSNVIGVANSESVKQNIDKQNLGIDVHVKSKHEILVDNKKIITKISNSYATPYITAFIGSIKPEKKEWNVCEAKKAINKKYKQNEHTILNCPLPDWISYAVLIEVEKKSNEDYYFECSDFEHADTVIVKNIDLLMNCREAGKHLVYLGEEKVMDVQMDKFFWCKQNRIKQIIECRKMKEELEIPVVLLESENEIDEIRLLLLLQNTFQTDGYNMYPVSLLIDSVLYGLEYIPEEVLSDTDQLHNFLYWQIYYKKSDILVIAANNKFRLKKYIKNIDLLVNVSHCYENIELIYNNIKQYFDIY